MKTIILAGGKGTRLHPYTMVFPKPLMPIGDRPILDIVIQQLAFYGLQDITLSVGHLSELIRSYFQNTNGRFYRVNFSYIYEKKPLGTAGSLALIPSLHETFVVMNGDVLTNIDYTDLVSYHRQHEAILTIAMYSKNVNIDLGVIETDSSFQIKNYIEKPTRSYHVSMGIYVYEPRVLNYIHKGVRLDFPDLVLRLLAAGEKVVGYPFNGYWLDIGRPEDYAEAQREFSENQDIFLPVMS